MPAVFVAQHGVFCREYTRFSPPPKGAFVIATLSDSASAWFSRQVSLALLSSADATNHRNLWKSAGGFEQRTFAARTLRVTSPVDIFLIFDTF